MQKIVFEDTTVVKSPYVTIDGVEYSVENGTYQGGTDLNADTFNQMQDNIENAIPEVVNSLSGDSTTNAPSQRAVNTLKPVVLYNNTSGTNGNIQLSDSASNYSYLEIYYNRNNLGYSSMKIDTNYMTDVSLVTSYFQSDILRFYVSNISISGITITRNYSRYLNATASTSSSTMTSDDDNYFYINKVIGYIKTTD